MIEVKVQIFESDGYICAAGEGTGIFTYAKFWNKLMKNLNDAIALYYEIPSCKDVRVVLELEPKVMHGAEITGSECSEID
jgi:hypothetical protein